VFKPIRNLRRSIALTAAAASLTVAGLAAVAVPSASAATATGGATDSLTKVVVDLPPASAWNTRTQTLSVLGSTDGSNFSTLVGSATYTFNPSTGNTVSIPLPSGTSDQYVRLSFTANSVQNGAQASELDIYGP
jgi:hypothetical protein